MQLVDASDPSVKPNDFTKIHGKALGARLHRNPSVIPVEVERHGDAILAVHRLAGYGGRFPRSPGEQRDWYFDVNLKDRKARFICRRYTESPGQRNQRDRTLPERVATAVEQDLCFEILNQ